MQDVSYDQVIALLSVKQNGILLLQVPDEPLCARVRQALTSHIQHYKLYNFYILALNINKYSSKYHQLACIHVPKIRVFVHGECRKEIRGVPSNIDFDQLVHGIEYG